MDNATYRVFFTAATARIQNFKLTIKDIVEDPLANKVVVYARSTADTAAGKDTYGNEYFLLLEFNEAGDKISKLVEYVDSAKTKEQVAILLG
jgi:ketosteroid isomerase-like protein